MSLASKPKRDGASFANDDAAPPYDRAVLLERACADDDLLAQIVEIFFETAPPLRAALIEQVANRDNRAERTAHAMAGMLLNLSADHAAKIARELEALTFAGKWDAAGPVAERLERALDRLEAALTADRNAVKGSP